MVFVGGEEFFRTKWVVPGVFSSLIFVSPYIRTVKTASGAMAVQVVFSERKGAKRMKHIGSAHSESELALLRAEAQRIVDGDQLALDFGEVKPGGGKTPVKTTPTARSGHKPRQAMRANTQPRIR